ncbi:MAG: AbrB/MazE/SpoVT family DNA-binding domain-containing protein [Enterocloster bolteae]
MERKIISISSKRQVTIPQKYFELLGFDDEAECILQDGGVFIRPVRIGGNEFAEQILADLIAEGYSGTELLERFKEQSRKVRPAVENMIAEADRIAKEGASIPMGELFGTEGE